jgi:FkbM family methyltransferase
VYEDQFTGALGRHVSLRPGTSDRQVWADTFTGLYHLPPAELAPATVLDLGANIGLTAAHYAQLWPEARVVAVEMDDECCELIRVNAPTVEVRQEAVSGLGEWGSYDSGVLAEAFAFRPWWRSGKLVESRPLREIIFGAFEPGTVVDFVKMDVEGMEWSLFAHGSWAPLVSSLLVELHGPGGSQELIVRAIVELERLGFEARHHPPHPQAVYATAG